MEESEVVSAGEAGAPTVATPPRSSRFGVGVAVGISVGVVTVVVVLGLIWFGGMVLASRAVVDSGSAEVTYVKSTDPWLKMTDSTHGRVAGYSATSMSTSSYEDHGAIGRFGLTVPTNQEGVLGFVTVNVWVRPDTELTMGGKPWRPKQGNLGTPAEALFGVKGFGEDTSLLDRRHVTVDFRRVGHDLVAQRVDASQEETMPPFWMEWDY